MEISYRDGLLRREDVICACATSSSSRRLPRYDAKSGPQLGSERSVDWSEQRETTRHMGSKASRCFLPRKLARHSNNKWANSIMSIKMLLFFCDGFIGSLVAMNLGEDVAVHWST